MVPLMRITADDRLDIIELPSRYADALDTLQPEQLRDVHRLMLKHNIVTGEDPS